MEKIKMEDLAMSSQPPIKTTVPDFCEKHKKHFVESETWNDVDKCFDWFCPDCNNSETEKRLTDIALASRVMAAKASLVLPKRLQDYTFSSFNRTNENKKIIETCFEYVQKWPGGGGGLALLGGVGTGKTHIAVAICQSLVKTGVLCNLTTVTRIVRDIRSTWQSKDVSENEVLEKYVNYDLLVIDEIGVQYGSESEMIIINEIINDRYEKMLPTIVIGNVSKSELVTILGARVVDRITHGGSVLIFNWESGRK